MWSPPADGTGELLDPDNGSWGESTPIDDPGSMPPT